MTCREYDLLLLWGRLCVKWPGQLHYISVGQLLLQATPFALALNKREIARVMGFDDTTILDVNLEIDLPVATSYIR